MTSFGAARLQRMEPSNSVGMRRARARGRLREVVRRAVTDTLARRHGYRYVTVASMMGVWTKGRRALTRRRRPPMEPLGVVPGEDRTERGPALVARPSLEGLAPALRKRFARYLPLSLPPAEVVVLHDAVVVGIDGWISRDGLRILAGVPAEPTAWDHDGLLRAGRVAGARPECLRGTSLSLLTPSARSFYHWLVEAVPRAFLVEAELRAGAFDRVLVPDRLLRYHRDALHALRIEPSLWFEVADRPYRCERLVTTTSPSRWGYLRDGVVHQLKVLFDVGAPEPVRTRLFVSRGDAPGRQITNEQEVLALLEPMGFERVTMTGRSLPDQARLFARAQVIVAPHGAALANLVFAGPGTSLVELLPANYRMPTYCFMAASMGLPYRALVGVEPAARGPFTVEQWRADLTVDVPRLAQVLEVLLDTERGSAGSRSAWPGACAQGYPERDEHPGEAGDADRDG